MRNIGEGIWIFERQFRFLGAEFGNRMTVVRLGNEELFIHSPIALDDELKSQVEKLGRVVHIVTPNAFHGLFVEDWISAFPFARHFTAKGGRQDREFLSIDLSDSTTSAFSPTLEVIHVQGIPKLNEFAFFHKVSRTLILTDLAFNIGKNVSYWTKIFFSLNGAYGKFGPSRLMRSMIEDQATLKDSLMKMYEWDFDRIVVSHGDIVEKDGKETMRSAFQQCLANSSNRHRTASLRSPIRCG